MKKIVVVSDLQVPFHDIKATQVLAKFIKYFKPDEVILIGDEIDFNTISKWSRGQPKNTKRQLDRIAIFASICCGN
jgi:predicted phosphodiesterase